MVQMSEVEAPNCPFLTPEVGGRRGVFPFSVYCRLPSGRVRVPTRDQLVALCTAGQHQKCFAYCRWAPTRVGG